MGRVMLSIPFNSIQQMSNSLFPCELLEIVHAKAEVIEESAKIDMLLKANRVDKEQKRKSLGTQEQRPNHFKASRKRCLLHVATERHNGNKTHCNGNLVATKHGWTLSLLVPTIWPGTLAESKQCLLKMRRSSQIVNTRSIAIKELFSTAVLYVRLQLP
ncbi:hypothetical protein RHSIM_Rhsim12G0072700 [Rhododendron simsii]|uniref:Uncharacterized protein n=1 Tax=Rhododendron simsii TaxID=118357 RepID=A0A834G5J6_RHOSS|nr:hypothetical protein RHSIM_Rhsim12G0072700 [Rhododendron simsii]